MHAVIFSFVNHGKVVDKGPNQNSNSKVGHELKGLYNQDSTDILCKVRHQKRSELACGTLHYSLIKFYITMATLFESDLQPTQG